MATKPFGKKRWPKEHQALAREAGHKSWEGWILALETEKGWEICGARAGPLKDHPCQLRAGSGCQHRRQTGRCNFHGGDSKRGQDSATYVHGKCAKPFLLDGRVGEILASLTDEEVYDLTLTAKLNYARIMSILEDLPKGELSPAALSRRISSVLPLLRELGPDPSPREARKLGNELELLDQLLTGMDRQAMVWEEFSERAEIQRKLTETVTKQRAKEFGQVDWVDILALADGIRRMMVSYVPAPDHVDFQRDFESMLKGEMPKRRPELKVI